MSNIYLTVHDFGNGKEIAGIHDDKEAGIAYAEQHLFGQYTYVIEYPIGWGMDDGRPEHVASWHRRVVGLQYEYARIL